VSVPGVQSSMSRFSIIGAFRRMCRTLEFDVCEMAITTYLTAKAHDKPFTALPVFHAPVPPLPDRLYIKSGVQSPKGSRGQERGCARVHRHHGVWTRVFSRRSTGVDLDKITWVVVDEEHVQEYRNPPM